MYNKRKRGVNIIPRGVTHAQRNNIPRSADITPKGIPIVECNLETRSCEQRAEIEKNELITHKELSIVIEDLSKRYLSTGDEKIALELGKIMYIQLKNNTKDNNK